MKKTLLAAWLVLASAVGANAATITFTDSAAFFAALGATPYTTETYEGLAVNTTISPGTTVNGITYSSFPAGTSGRIDNTFNRIGDRSLALTGSQNFFLPGQSIDVSFAPTTAIGVFFNVNPSAPNSLFIQTAVGTAGNGPAYDQSTLYFVGLISDSPFSSARIGGTTGAQSFNLDNLTLATGTTSVPEPASMFLLGSGLLALRMRARRSRSL
ncbi:MAG: PEP-CTERM sorting domain-containing protein [Vicinamibacterales bacterium]